MEAGDESTFYLLFHDRFPSHPLCNKYVCGWVQCLISFLFFSFYSPLHTVAKPPTAIELLSSKSIQIEDLDF